MPAWHAVVSRGRTVVSLKLEVPGVKPWTAETPHLYTLVLTLSVPGTAEAQVSQGGGGSDAHNMPAGGITYMQQVARVAVRTAPPCLPDVACLPVQVESTRVGFRVVSINAEGQVTVNGRAITVQGVNRHEHDPVNGKVGGAHTRPRPPPGPNASTLLG